ncbi:MAG: serine/threonine-protein kinase [Vicinamibacterales bacterium]
MTIPLEPARVRLERLPAHAWAVIAVLVLSLGYALLDVTRVRPYLWPAGTGAMVTADPASHWPLISRPPDLQQDVARLIVVTAVEPSTPAARHGVTPGATVDAITARGTAVDLRPSARLAPPAEIAAWRARYWSGVSGPVTWRLRDEAGAREVTIERPSVASGMVHGWARLHLGMIVQLVVFLGGAIVLMLLRSDDLSAGLCAAALALSAVAGGGPLLGAEAAVPLGRVLTLFAWLASPLAFPTIALAILHFPTRSPLIVRHPWLQAVPFAAAAPMIGPSLLTALYLAGVDAARDGAIWDATHRSVYAASFAAALAINLAAIAEGVYRFRFNHDASQRRRIRMAVYTAVPGVVAYALKDGLPIAAMLSGGSAPRVPGPIYVLLQALVLLPAFGLAYAVGVSRVLGPRVVLRRSLQYALARKSLGVLAVLPVVALVFSLVRDRGRTLGEIALGSAGLYIGLSVVLAATLRYRDRAKYWLDQHFFREEYDARKILVSLASRVRYETDPADLAAMVVGQIDEALHPTMVAILVGGLEPGQLVPVTVLHGSADSLSLESGLGGMLRWSSEPLDVMLTDPRSPVRRLPADDQEWLHCTGAALLVPVVAQDSALIAVIVLGERRSEEAYTDEDCALLGSIAAQMGLGFDVARLRRRAATRDDLESQTTQLVAAVASPMMECPRCGRCEDITTSTCPLDGTALHPVAGVTRIVDNKYRIEHLLGRGGMGAVYQARDMRLDRLVALKVVRAELLSDPESRLRFRREAQIIARLHHPSIVAVYDYGTFADGGAFIVMELVRGEDLRKVLQREGRIEPGRAVRILESVCGAIEAAHREGVLHRDLKPENILLPGGAAEAKVLDFGVAKVVIDDRHETMSGGPDDSTLVTAPGLIVGTPAYMAPEQFNASQTDARTDVFSLGVIAYEMLSGALPFGRGTLTEIVLAHARGVPPMPSGAAAPEVERAVRAALEADPDRRPASAQAFAYLVGSASGQA